MQNIAVIPARSGSKGLPDKNILPLNGKPLLAWSIDAARQSGMFDKIYVSTNSEKYAEIARKYGADVPFLRSPAAASDTASSWLAVSEALEKYGDRGEHFDTISLLQPTSPLRTAEDIRGAFRVMEQRNAQAVVSVCETEQYPLWSNTLPEDGSMYHFLPPAEKDLPRQAMPLYYQINGAIYLLSVKAFQEHGQVPYDNGCFAYIMPRERSVDIDKAVDFAIAEALWHRFIACKDGESPMSSCR